MHDKWTGPRTFSLSKHSEHTNVVRYKCRVENREFDYYAPKTLLTFNEQQYPEKIEITIMQSDLPIKEIGFRGEAIRPRIDSDFWEYDLFDDDLVNSVRYVVKFEKQSYSIYVPRGVFANLQFPKRLLVYVDAIRT